MPIAEPMTAKQFLTLPVPQSGRPWNLVDGEVVVNEPTALHGHLQATLFRALDAWIAGEGHRGTVMWPLDIALEEDNVFAPDLLWYAEGRTPDLRSLPPYPIPDLAVEISSPSTWRYDIGAKRSTYERHGLPELWLIDTAADAVLVYRRASRAAAVFDVALELTGSDQLCSPRLEGFAIAAESLFPPR